MNNSKLSIRYEIGVPEEEHQTTNLGARVRTFANLSPLY